ncbi:phosphoribosyltransferase-like protein [Lactarius quietus]|nr:phosphoribosyltransferase-like protein [Lactarius quietus]
MSDIEFIKSFLTIHQNFPKKGVAFCDIFPIFRNPLAFEALITHLVHHLVSNVISNSPEKKIDVIVGLDSRGFLIGPVIALRLGAAFVPVRKRGKLPGLCERAGFEKEYGTVCKRHRAGTNGVVVDDLIATGGSAAAAGDLVRKQGGKLLLYLFIAEVITLNGKDKLDAPTYSMVQIDGSE